MSMDQYIFKINIKIICLFYLIAGNHVQANYTVSIIIHHPIPEMVHHIPDCPTVIPLIALFRSSNHVKMFTNRMLIHALL